MRQHTAPQILVVRAKIILLSAEGHGIKKVARMLHVSRNMVRKWRRRWSEIGDKEDIAGHLSDAPRSGAPATFTPENICSIVAIACDQVENRIQHLAHALVPWDVRVSSCHKKEKRVAQDDPTRHHSGPLHTVSFPSCTLQSLEINGRLDIIKILSKFQVVSHHT